MDEVVDTALALELVVQARVEGDGDPVGRGDGPALLAGSLDEHLVCAELVPCRAEPAVGKLLEVSGCERLAHRGELFPELRPEEPRFGFTFSSLASTVPNDTSLDPQLFADLAGMRLGERGSFHHERAERLAQVHAGSRARLPAELDDAPHRRDLLEEARVRRRRLRPAGQEDGLGSVLARCRQLAPEVVAEERHDGGDHA